MNDFQEDESIIRIAHGNVIKAGNTVLFEINLQIKSGQVWAITGPSGSGKTTLLEVIAGTTRLNSGELHYNFKGDAQWANLFTNVSKPIALVSLKHHFRDASNTTSFYYQQRYNSSDSENSATVATYLDSVKTMASGGNSRWPKDVVIEKLHLSHLLPRHLIQLSNGETRRVMIAAALLKNPALLLLDAPLTGLDVTTRHEINHLLNQIAASGVGLMIATSARQIPDAVTHVVELNEGSITAATTKADYLSKKHIQAAKQSINTGIIQQLYTARYLQQDYQYLVDMQQVNISYGNVQVLHNINWRVLPGERWSLSGPNGAGKSTLLSLINGDNPQAYANHISLFDRRRGSGESIWDIKKNIGFVSPELYQYFPADQSCLQVIESGYYDTLGLFRMSQSSQADKALHWMKALEIDQYARKLFRQIPAGAQRLCLLARALVKSPPLLVLDEPCQGLDDEQQQNFKQVVDTICAAAPVGLIYVTHYPHELPDSIQHHLQLSKGEVMMND